MTFLYYIAIYYVLGLVAVLVTKKALDGEVLVNEFFMAFLHAFVWPISVTLEFFASEKGKTLLKKRLF